MPYPSNNLNLQLFAPSAPPAPDPAYNLSSHVDSPPNYEEAMTLYSQQQVLDVTTSDSHSTSAQNPQQVPALPPRSNLNQKTSPQYLRNSQTSRSGMLQSSRETAV